MSTSKEPATVGKREQSDPRWQEFERKHLGHPSLAEDSIYALTPALIKSLQDVAAHGGVSRPFFTKEQLKFELDLVALGGMGFFHKWPIEYLSFPLPAKRLPRSETERELDEKHRRAHVSIEAMLKEVRGPSEW